jgi:hypothetical protein
MHINCEEKNVAGGDCGHGTSKTTLHEVSACQKKTAKNVLHGTGYSAVGAAFFLSHVCFLSCDMQMVMCARMRYDPWKSCPANDEHHMFFPCGGERR